LIVLLLLLLLLLLFLMLLRLVMLLFLAVLRGQNNRACLFASLRLCQRAAQPAVPAAHRVGPSAPQTARRRRRRCGLEQ
jgi:hypothetical protein